MVIWKKEQGYSLSPSSPPPEPELPEGEEGFPVFGLFPDPELEPPDTEPEPGSPDL